MSKNSQKPKQDPTPESRPQEQDTPRDPERTSTVLHCGMRVDVFNNDETVFCNGCHDWVKVAACEAAPAEKE